MASPSPPHPLTPERRFNIPQPRRSRTVQKCRFCRESRRSCSFSNGRSASRCRLCQEKGLPCSEPQLAPRRMTSYHPTVAMQGVSTNFSIHHSLFNLDEAIESPAIVADSNSDSWTVSEPAPDLSETEKILLLCLHTIFLMAIEELIHLATALLKPYRRDRLLESTTDSIPLLTSAVDGLKGVARAVNARIIEVGPGPHLMQAQNALTAYYFQSKHTWGSDEASTNECRAAVEHFRKMDYGCFAYILRMGLVQQGIPLSPQEVEDMCHDRELFFSAVEAYAQSGQVPALSQYVVYQLYTPRNLIQVPKIATSIMADGRPDLLGRSALQVIYDANAHTSRLFEGLSTGTLNWNDKLGRTILHQALQKSDIPMTKSLVRLGADVRRLCLNGLSSVHIAACQGNLELVTLLLTNPKWPTDIPDGSFRTPFWYAARASQFEMMSLLAARPDVDIDSKDIHEMSPLAIAARDGRTKVIKHILKLRCNVWELGVSGALTEHMHDHRPLSLASKNGHHHCVDLILANRTWNAGGHEWVRTRNLAAQQKDNILLGRLLDLSRTNAGVADLTQFYLPKSRKPCNEMDVDLSVYVRSIHGTKPGGVVRSDGSTQLAKQSQTY